MHLERRTRFTELDRAKFAWLSNPLATPPDQPFDLEAYVAAAKRMTLATLAGLPDEASFVSAAQRLGLPETFTYQTEGVEDVRLWLTATEWRHIDVVLEMIEQCQSKEGVTRMAQTLALVEAPEVAPAMLEIQMETKAAPVAAKWFVTNPLITVVGLAPLAMGTDKTAAAAREVLHNLNRGGQQAAIEQAAAHLPEHVQQWLREKILTPQKALLEEAAHQDLPEAVAEALSRTKASKPPAWLQMPMLGAIRFQNKRLAASDIGRVLTALKESPLGKEEKQGPADSLLLPLKAHAERNSLDSFAWSLFDQWLTMGAPSKDKWAMGALGHFGGDASALKLPKLIREWVSWNKQRAAFALEILRTIGSDTALMALHGISQNSAFRSLKDKAQALMEAIATSRGLTREELADRIVPDCGLDPKGSRTFDFGPRQFKFVLGPEMKPMVRDAAGKVRTDLPAPNSSDDKEKADSAVADWKLFKKSLKEVFKAQALRMEDAMITGRRWTADQLSQFFIHHPLQLNLARQLVFGVYGDTGTLTQTFRITEDQTLADSKDEPFELPPELSAKATIGLVHAAQLDELTKSAWGQIFSDYQIIPPFPQINREVCLPEPEDLKLDAITRFKGPRIPGIVVFGTLERCQWLRDIPADGGGFMQHSKFFPSANLTAFIQYTGLTIGYYDDPQQIESVYFVPGHIKPDWWGTHTNKLLIDQVDPVILSEVLRLVRALVAKAG